MHKFQYKFIILNFLKCANLHMIKKFLLYYLIKSNTLYVSKSIQTALQTHLIIILYLLFPWPLETVAINCVGLITHRLLKWAQSVRYHLSWWVQSNLFLLILNFNFLCRWNLQLATCLLECLNHWRKELFS
jgi:hypothetical protein